MPYQISAVARFSASHQLRLYDGSLEPLHGHNWVATARVAATKLDAIGVVMDFHELERLLAELCQPMHNRHLNDLPAFETLNPSAENVAGTIGKNLMLPQGVWLVSVEVQETPDCRALYLP